MNSIFDKTVCLSVTFRKPGCTRKASLQDVQTDAEKGELGLTKRIFTSDSYQRCDKINVATRQWLETRCVPSPLRAGTYLIPERLVDSVEERLTLATKEYLEAADEFCTEYPWLVKKWEKKLGSYFDTRNYPTATEMRRRFRVDRMILNFSPARPDEIDQQKEIQDAVNEIKAALRCGLLELVQRISGMLGETADGKRKRLSSKALETFNEWIGLLPDRLVVDDDELKAIAEKAKQVMAGKSADDLRNMTDVRTQVKKELEGMGTQLKKMVEDMPKRAFGFDDE